MAIAWSWGRLQACEHTALRLADSGSALAAVTHTRLPGLAYGMGRSYGDVCLNPGGVMWHTQGMNRYISFDPETGVLECEAGVLLGEIQRLMIPRGWALPVVPGTQFVTVGGAIANDVHGKNHHGWGSFGDHVQSLTLVRTTGEAIVCGPAANSEWFRATVGGLGLTGLITTAALQLRRATGAWLETETQPFDSLNEFFQLADDSESGWEHTVAWVDCLSAKGRGLFMRANPGPRSAWWGGHAPRLEVPLVPPVSLVNGLTLKPFNSVYYELHARRTGRRAAHYVPFFHPLDSIAHWNRIYGPKGFRQYQCVVPREVGDTAMGEMLSTIAQSGQGSFLAVLKTFGERAAPGMLSFCRPGVTLALDFPESGERTEALFRRLDAIVQAAGGRLYPAKDSRMPADLFQAGYPQLEEFSRWRDPGIRSSMSLRLTGI